MLASNSSSATWHACHVCLAVLNFDARQADEVDPSDGESMLANWQFATASSTFMYGVALWFECPYA